MKSNTIKFLTLGAFAASLTIFAGCSGGGDDFHRGNNGGNNGGSTGTAPFAFQSSIGSAATLSEPDAITINAAGSLFVASYAIDLNGTPRITTFDKNGNKVGDFGNTGTTATGLLAGPQGVAVDSAGNIYVADAPNFRVVKYNAAGKFVATLLQNQCGFPYQINVDSSNNLYVACSNTTTAGVTNQASVVKFSATGSILLVVGNSGIAGQTLQDADGVALDGANNIIVSDYTSGAIFAFSPTGTYLGTFGNTGGNALQGPQGLYVNKGTGQIFVADLVADDVAIYDTNGNFLYTVSPSNGSGVLNGPYDVNMDSKGNLYVVDEMDNRVAVFGPETTAQARPLAANTVRKVGVKSTKMHH
ncbi:MAG TPA: NHL repeat-containing protein [Fimbriimonadaceae bacterium]|jgi:DNA-binding beta-propeller fold protein YncE